MKAIIEKIVVALALLVILFLVVKVLAIGIEKSDRVECQKLLSQYREYPLFYLTPNEKEMCDYLGVTIPAPVKYE